MFFIALGIYFVLRGVCVCVCYVIWNVELLKTCVQENQLM